eukprot:5321292-Alexandrium_andersonii.AAC.1
MDPGAPPGTRELLQWTRELLRRTRELLQCARELRQWTRGSSNGLGSPSMSSSAEHGSVPELGSSLLDWG